MEKKDFENDLDKLDKDVDYLEFMISDDWQQEEEEKLEDTAEKIVYSSVNPPPKNGRMELYDWIQCIVFALICGIVIFLFFGRIVAVEGTSMYATLHNNDKLITSNLFYEPEQGDIIVFQTDAFGEQLLVKRVIATGGQTVDIDFDKGIVYVDGTALQEEYIFEPTFTQEDFSDSVTVPEGYLFVMGDNRNASTDSRSERVGLVDERCIIGKVYVIALPGGDKGEARDWSRVGLAH